MRRVVARVLVAGPDHTPQERSVLERISTVLSESGHRPTTFSRADTELRALLSTLESADALVAVLDGAEPDAATCLLVGLARAYRRPVLGMRSDRRGPAGSKGIPASIRSALTDLEAVSDWGAPATAERVRSFASGVRVFAGTLVRDAVPKILEGEGRTMQFRQVAEPEYPAVLKRKVVETAQRLEESDFGVEQEEIADLLELLETLINLRRYDRESLRSIKEGKWRKRGGFQKGFLLEEEPQAQSR